MINKNKTFVIDENNIFLNDKLKREIEIENLSSLIVSTEEAFTMSINADWGAGKTTFIKLWKEYLEQEHDVNSIYFSVWEDDFSNEPLISILGEINDYISEKFEDKDEVIAKLDTVKEFGGKVIKRGLPAFISGITGGILDTNKGIESAISAITKETTKNLIENYSKEKKITEKFQESIETLLTHIDNDKPFVIFIDELDRCRPLYAIELLERVKHIFGIDGLVFVLSIDKKQLSESIKSQYGNIDTNSYLKRFIDLEYNLVNTSKDDFCDYLYDKYKLDSLIRAKDIRNIDRGDLDHLEMMKYLSESLNLTLREIEQAFIQINIVFKTIQPRLLKSYFRVFVFFIILRIKDQSLYFDLIHKRKSHDEIMGKIILTINKNDNIYDLGTVLKSLIYATSTTDEELNSIISKEENKLEMMKDDNSNSIYDDEQIWLVDLLTTTYGEWRGFRLNKLIDSAIKKIEFVDRFNFE